MFCGQDKLSKGCKRPNQLKRFCHSFKIIACERRRISVFFVKRNDSRKYRFSFVCGVGELVFCLAAGTAISKKYLSIEAFSLRFSVPNVQLVIKKRWEFVNICRNLDFLAHDCPCLYMRFLPVFETGKCILSLFLRKAELMNLVELCCKADTFGLFWLI